MLVGLIVVPLVSLGPRKPKKEDMERIFSCYSAEVVVHAKSSLKEKRMICRGEKRICFSKRY